MPRRPPPPLAVEFDDDERDAVLAANRTFYRAFNDRDLDAMETLWAASGQLICLHPGHGPLYQRAEIMASWRAIMSHPESPKVRCADEWTTGRPTLAIIVCREILTDGQLMATNTFVRQEDGWRMIGHHSAPVPSSSDIRNARDAASVTPPRDRRKLH